MPIQTKLTNADKAERDSKARVLEGRDLAKDYPRFFREACKVTLPEPLTESWHYDYLCEWLQYAASGQMKIDHPEWRGIIINIPPRTLKSSIANVILPAWVWGWKPETRFLCVSWGQTFSENEISVPRRRLIESDWYQQRYPKTRISSDMNMKDRYDSTSGGYMVSCGCGGSGMGANIVIIDDIVQLNEAYDSAREKANEYYQSVLTSRRNNAATDFYIVISQRLHESDLPGYLLKNEAGLWKHIAIPLEAEKDELYDFPLSGRVYDRPKGDVLLASRFPEWEIKLKKQNPIFWAGQSQQQPMPDTGNFANPADFMEYETDYNGVPVEGALPSFDMVLFSVDASFKQTGDPCAITKQAFNRERQYILDCVNEGMDEPMLESRIINMIAEDAKLPIGQRATILLIEEAANGAAVIQRLKRLEHPLPVTIVAVKPEGGKQSRAMANLGDIVGHNVYLPKVAPWKQAFVKQLALGIGNQDHDDMIDSWSQGGTYRREHRWGYFESLEKRKAETTAVAKPLTAPQVTKEERDKLNEKIVRREWSKRLRRRF